MYGWYIIYKANHDTTKRDYHLKINHENENVCVEKTFIATLLKFFLIRMENTNIYTYNTQVIYNKFFCFSCHFPQQFACANCKYGMKLFVQNTQLLKSQFLQKNVYSECHFHCRYYNNSYLELPMQYVCEQLYNNFGLPLQLPSIICSTMKSI